MAELNPYEELGVERDATADEINRAYRRRSKATHPDLGGTPEAFSRTATALTVLIDPARRRTYDETGRIDEPGVDNDRAGALQIVEKHVGDIVNAFLADVANAALDPRRMDVPAEIVRRIEVEIVQGEIGLVGGAKIVDILRDMASRFSVKDPASVPAGEEDPITRGFKQQVEQNERTLAGLRRSIAVHRIAVEIARGYEFRIDPAAGRSAGRRCAGSRPPASRGSRASAPARSRRGFR